MMQKKNKDLEDVTNQEESKANIFNPNTSMGNKFAESQAKPTISSLDQSKSGVKKGPVFSKPSTMSKTVTSASAPV
jgi:hypothetical protein